MSRKEWRCQVASGGQGWREWRQEKWRQWRRGRRRGKGCSELRSVVRIRVDGWRLRARIGVWTEGVYAW